MSGVVVTYGATAADYWTGEGDINIRDVKGKPIAIIPLRFLTVAMANTWSYIDSVVRDCVENDGYLTDNNGSHIMEDSVVSAGSFIFVRSDDTALGCTYARGPESPRMGRAPGFSDTEDSSSFASSGRSSKGQNKFRFDVAVRDTGCLVTGAPSGKCTASHIVPISRRDLYPRILNRDALNINLYEPRMGLLLRQDLHVAFDKYDWALLPLQDTYVVHYFKPGEQSDRVLHGKRISYNRLGFEIYPEAIPDRRLLLWHYKQCIQMHFRGFSYRISAQDTIEDMQSAIVSQSSGVAA